jgi:TPR repeat protein
MRVELRLNSTLRCLTGVLVAVLLSASSAFAGAFEDANAAYDRKDYATALRLVRPLAEQGDPKAQGLLGDMYWTGGGVPQDYAEAVAWFRKAAQQGDDSAQFALGNIYEHKPGDQHGRPPQDYAEAAKWYGKAAQQGNVFGQLSLASMYEEGRGVPQDYVLAHMWWNLATAHGATDAAKFRDELAAKMTPEQVADAQRLAREWKPTK